MSGESRQEDRVGAGGFMTIAQVAEYLSLSKATVYRMMSNGELRSAKIGRGRRIPRQDVVALGNRSLVTGPAG